jgi:surface polysaccharide O-acyltransferase-like enzyme
VILLHAAIEPFPITDVINQTVIIRWLSVDIYDSISRIGVPLFVMLSGALLLQPYKAAEPLNIFFKKRFIRVGLPLIFWGAAYFAWSYSANSKPLTLASIGLDIAEGPYYHFWFLYMLIGLYLVTPFLRLLVAHADRKLLRYFLVLWFVGSAVVSVVSLFETYTLSSDVFILTGFIGYYLLGVYLLNDHVKSKILYTIFFVGIAWTSIGTYVITSFVGGTEQYFFYNFLGINVILTSVAMFLLLRSLPVDYIEKKSKSANRLIHFISQCSLAIYLMHVIVLESLQRGYFGLRISINTINPIVEIPLITVVTLLICVAILYPVSKITSLKRIIGVID